MSDSVWPHRWQPTRLPRPWGFPGKNTGVGCHFLLQCMKVKNESEVTQSCLALSDPVDCSLPGSSIHGIFQARVREWVAIAFEWCEWYISTYSLLFNIANSAWHVMIILKYFLKWCFSFYKWVWNYKIAYFKLLWRCMMS